ncbi:MAG TPA: SUMF1/EgtB/PvdO family nonheme iron enzyme, partial [Fibrobacteraceae bacterium]|nr:SUMF1/EgtB/PvdO family nonheme iron enzyme [Fibrobacteraceae bacterium]
MNKSRFLWLALPLSVLFVGCGDDSTSSNDDASSEAASSVTEVTSSAEETSSSDEALSSEEGTSSEEGISSEEGTSSATEESSSSEEEVSSAATTSCYTTVGGNQIKIQSNGQTFTMGSAMDSLFKGQKNSRTYFSESPTHSVSFSYDFYMDTTEVTQAMFSCIMSAASIDVSTIESSWNDVASAIVAGDNLPAWNVDAYTAILFANARSTLDGLTPAYTIGDDSSVTTDYTANGYRLPTEAEWEFAARAGSTSDGYWGWTYSSSMTADDSTNLTNNAIWEYNSYDYGTSSTEYGPHVVASKSRNDFGLYDMIGNVSEWTNDFTSTYDSSAVTDPHVDTDTYSLGRVLRGGNWTNGPVDLRVSNRLYENSSYLYYGYGFRLVR